MVSTRLRTLWSDTLTTPRLSIKLFDPTIKKDYSDVIAVLNAPFVIHRMGDLHVRTGKNVDSRCVKSRPGIEICDNLAPGTETPSHPYHLVFLKHSGEEGGRTREQIEAEHGCEDKCIGAISLTHRKSSGLPPDIGWAFLEEYTRKGYGTEAARAVLQFWREEIGIREIWAGARETNRWSQRVIEKLGMIDGGSFRVNMPNGDVEDVVGFVLPGMKKFNRDFVLDLRDVV